MEEQQLSFNLEEPCNHKVMNYVAENKVGGVDIYKCAFCPFEKWEAAEHEGA